MPFVSLIDKKLSSYPVLFRCASWLLESSLILTHRYLFPSISLQLRIFIYNMALKCYLETVCADHCSQLLASLEGRALLSTALVFWKEIHWVILFSCQENSPASCLRWHVPVCRGLGRNWGDPPFRRQLSLSSFWFQPPHSFVLYHTYVSESWLSTVHFKRNHMDGCRVLTTQGGVKDLGPTNFADRLLTNCSDLCLSPALVSTWIWAAQRICGQLYLTSDWRFSLQALHIVTFPCRLRSAS